MLHYLESNIREADLMLQKSGVNSAETIKSCQFFPYFWQDE